ncbi:MAG: HEAT repeat domain-containing protein [Gemmatimonadetes bacterium]|nr:MAG: HEAT repeat domain-containing protein [Gemmatimonadota bacterium]
MALEGILAQLQHPAWHIRQQALQTVCGDPQPDWIPRLLPHLNHPDWKIRDCLHTALTQLCRQLEPPDHAVIVGQLLPYLSDPHLTVQRAVCEALAYLPDPRTIAPIRRYLTHPDPYLRRTACDVLGQWGDPLFIPDFAACLSDEDEAVRYLAVLQLVQFDLPDALQALLRAVDDPFPRTREMVAAYLGNVGGDAAIHALIHMVEDIDRLVRRQAVAALGQVADLRATNPLLERLNDNDLAVQRAAAEALIQLGSVSVLEQMLRRYHYDEIERVIQGLRHMSNRLKPHYPNLICLDCLTRFRWRGLYSGFHYYGRFLCCRTCGRLNTARTQITEVVAVFDLSRSDPRWQDDDRLYINVQIDPQLYDFDRVEILNTTDEAVEAFCIRVKNDEDEFRRPNYRKIPVFVHCPLTENTMICRLQSSAGITGDTIRILKHTFGTVEVIEP